MDQKAIRRLYIEWCLCQDKLQHHWLTENVNKAAPSTTNITLGDRFIMWPYPGDLDNVAYGIISQVSLVVGSEPYFTYDITGDVGGQNRRGRLINSMNCFAWIPHIEQLAAAGYPDEAHNFLDIMFPQPSKLEDDMKTPLTPHPLLWKVVTYSNNMADFVTSRWSTQLFRTEAECITNVEGLNKNFPSQGTHYIVPPRVRI